MGFDTACNTVVEIIDKIRDTASSHNRLFFVEVMGRDVGFIALRSGIATGAETVLIPETSTTIEELVETIEEHYARKKASIIVVVAEGEEMGGAVKVAKKVSKRFTAVNKVYVYHCSFKTIYIGFDIGKLFWLDFFNIRIYQLVS